MFSFLFLADLEIGTDRKAERPHFKLLVTSIN
jgi:hypothetical protein